MSPTAQQNRRKSTSRKPAATSPKQTAQQIVDAAEARDSLGLASAAQLQAFDRFERFWEEGLRFAITRFEENRSVLLQLAETRTLPEHAAIWSRYMERAMQQYSENLGLLAGIYSAQARESVEESVEATQAATAAVAEVMPSPLAEAIPPLPAAEPEIPDEEQKETEAETKARAEKKAEVEKKAAAEKKAEAAEAAKAAEPEKKARADEKAGSDSTAGTSKSEKD